MPTVRNRTRVLAVVHSHLNDEPIHLSPDILSFKSNKSTKSTGTISLEVVPRSNYMNLIFPNDVLNVYVDPGDGQSGFIRLFMGYVDRVERTENTDEKGGISTSIRIVASDFQKVFEKTNIYVNPHLKYRQDLVDQKIGMSMLGGTGLRTLGIFASGSPADVIENIAHMLLGFGTQWALPISYSKLAMRRVSENRRRRKQRALDKLPDGLVEGLSAMVGDLDQALRDAGGRSFDSLDDFVVRANVSNLTGDAARRAEEQAKFIIETTATEEVLAKFKQGKQELRAYRTILNSVGENNPASFIDLLDFSFIEAAATDGFMTNTVVWDKSGPILSAMRMFSNDIVNELMFDLRPVARGSDVDPEYLDSCFGGEYSKEKDELGYNVDGWGDGKFYGSTPAVAYVPAIVFREYPYSCVQGLDLGGLKILSDKEPIGYIPFGPIYSEQGGGLEAQYRAIYNYKENLKEVKGGTYSFSNRGCVFEENHAPLKHLDVIKFYDSDLINAQLGRSDKDVFNLFTMSAQDPLQSVYKYILSAFMPVTSAVSIARNGIRAREITTRFANFGNRVVCADGEDLDVKAGVTKNMIRWLLLQDHWDQHNQELLSGTIVSRGRPEIRVGYRLDWEDRRESYYVESVSHSWAFGKEMVTSLQVSRGMRNDPFLSYVPPKTATIVNDKATQGFELLGGNRNSDGRLARYFEILDTKSTARATQNRGIWWSPYDDKRFLNAYDDANSVVTSEYGGGMVYSHSNYFPTASFDLLTSEELKSIASARGNQESSAAIDGNRPPPPPTQDKISMISRNVRKDFDDLFELIALPRGLPVEFMRALGKRESGLNPNNQEDPAWGLMQVGVDGFDDYPISGVSGKVLLSYNQRKGTNYRPPDMLDPAKNIEVASELLGRIVIAHTTAGLSPNWNSEHWVGLLVAGWNAGWSWKRGTAGAIKWMTSEAMDPVEPTIDNMVAYIPQMRIDGRNISKFLESSKKRGWWKGVVKQYFHEKNRG